MTGYQSHHKKQETILELKNEENYYLKRKPKLLRKFDQLARAMHQVLASYYGEEEAAGIVHAVRCEYESLVPELPYIGGRKNSLSDSLEGTAASLVLYKVMKARGENTADIGRIHQEIIETHLYSLPRWRFWMVGKIVSTGTGQRIFKHILRKRASESQQRHYAADFVFNVVEGEEGDFNFGIDYTECAIVKFFHSQGADEFTPYVCLYDYPLSRLIGTGLRRTMTLAEGEPKCDFRFRIGKEPQNFQATRISGF